MLFKGGDQTAIKNSLLSLFLVLLRIFDKILFARLDTFIEENNILSPNQYGGGKRRNPIGLVGNMMYKTLEIFGGHKVEIVLLLLWDQSNFHDRLAKNLLAIKAKSKIIQGYFPFQVIEIINNRQIFVRAKRKLVEPTDISNGSAQGLVLSLPFSSIYTEEWQKYFEKN